MCPASEISWAFTLVGERSLLLAIQFTREQHLAHIDGGELSFTADEVLTSSVGLGGPHGSWYTGVWQHQLPLWATTARDGDIGLSMLRA